jgi:membrane protein CcdC involved in cytochrome C biogenesis
MKNFKKIVAELVKFVMSFSVVFFGSQFFLKNPEIYNTETKVFFCIALGYLIYNEITKNKM